jgi:hypothetical protein
MAEKQDASAVESGVRAVDPRYPAEAISAITGMRLSPGEAVRLVNSVRQRRARRGENALCQARASA